MLQPPTHEFLHRTIQSRQMHEQFLKSLAGYSDRIEWCGSTDCRITWLVGNERGFAKNVARMQRCEQCPIALNGCLPFYDKVNFVAKIAICENRFPWLEMLAMYGFFVKEPKLRDVARQEDVENPVSNQAKLAVKSWEFRDVNAAP